MRDARFFIFWLVGILAGCAARAPADIRVLQQRVDDLAQRDEQNRRQLEELNNRIFILEDKVDTSRVALERSSKPIHLPVVRLRPRASGGVIEEKKMAPDDEDLVAAGSPEEDGETIEQEGSGSVVESSPVVYSGAAAQGGTRPVLRLHGGPPSRDTRTPELAGPDPATIKEQLPLTAVPKRTLSTKLAQAGASLLPMKDYQEAMSKYRLGQYTSAAQAFQAFVKRYAKHAYADNALYWLGECFYDLKDYRLSLKIFRQLILDYPSGNKAPDALLKMAYCHIRLKEERQAKMVFAQLRESYPKSDVARLASQALNKLPQREGE